MADTMKNDYKDEAERNTASGMNYGWICPVCGRGLSPYMSYCNCRKVTQKQVYKGKGESNE